MNVIFGFTGQYAFLSNFYPCEIHGGLSKAYPSVAHAYQTAKTLRPDLELMLTLLRLKFNQPYMREKLLATDYDYLEETNNWGDTFWGVCAGVGENHLGRLLMKVRKELREEFSEEVSC